MTKLNKLTRRKVWIALAAAALLTAATAGCGGDNSNNGGNEQSGVVQDGGSVGAGSNIASGISDPPVAGENGPAGPDSGSSAAAGGANAGTSVQGGTANHASNEPAAPDAGSAAVKNGTGTYVGQVDTHSVEINTGTESIVFQFEDELSGQLAALDDNSPVSFEYIEKTAAGGSSSAKQYWLKSIQPQTTSK